MVRHLKVRAKIEQREIRTQQFIQQVIEEYFMDSPAGINKAVSLLMTAVKQNNPFAIIWKLKRKIDEKRQAHGLWQD